MSMRSPVPGAWRRRTVPSEDAVELYEHAPCGYLSIHADDTISRVNQTFLDWTGWTRDALIGATTLGELLTGGGRLYFETHVRPALVADGSIHEVDLDLRRADGTLMPVLLNATVVRDEHDRLAGLRVSLFDVTRRREHEDELRRARREAEESERRARQLARTLQAALLPPLVPIVPGVDVGVAYLPAGDGFQIGGDFYDVFESSDQEWILALGDVCGKGAAAAAVTGLVRYSIQAASIRQQQPSRVLSDVNAVLLRDRSSDRFCTATCLRLRASAGEGVDVTFSLGGHPQPMLIAGDGVRPVGQHGTLLGILGDPMLHDTSLRLEPGDGLVIFTDGLTEARQGEEFLGDDGLAALLVERRHLGAQEMADDLARAALDFQEGTSRDDIVVMVLRVTPAA